MVWNVPSNKSWKRVIGSDHEFLLLPPFSHFLVGLFWETHDWPYWFVPSWWGCFLPFPSIPDRRWNRHPFSSHKDLRTLISQTSYEEASSPTPKGGNLRPGTLSPLPRDFLTISRQQNKGLNPTVYEVHILAARCICFLLLNSMVTKLSNARSHQQSRKTPRAWNSSPPEHEKESLGLSGSPQEARMGSQGKCHSTIPKPAQHKTVYLWVRGPEALKPQCLQSLCWICFTQ